MKYIGTIAFRTAAAALTVAVALSQPIAAQARGGGGGGFHGGGGGFHGGGFHGGGGFHAGAFHGGGFHSGGFANAHFGGNHFGHWHDRGFGNWGWGDAWPLVTDQGFYDDGYTDGDSLPTSSSSAQYWYYCQNPAGYYPYVTSCTTAWQPVPAG